MQTYELLVRNRSVSGNSDDMTLVRTSVGIDQIHVLFDNEEWLDFPITVTFGSGDDIVTQPVYVEPVDGVEWVAEATVTVPWEVVDETGRIRVTFQGTDSQGRHIITAKGSPLSVEEAGDVDDGSAPADAPTPSQYAQIYEDAVDVMRRLSEALEEIGDVVRRDDISGMVTFDDVATDDDLGIMRPDGTTTTVSNGVISAVIPDAYGIAEVGSVGVVMPDGTTITIDADGTIHAVCTVPIATTSVAGKVKPDGTTITVDRDGAIHAVGEADVPIATTSSPGKVKPDGTTITVDSDGTIHGSDTVPIATTSVAGKVKPDGTTVTVGQDGTISSAAVVPNATPTTKGIVSGPSINDNTGIYVSNGYLTDRVATHSRRGTVRIAEYGGIGVGYNTGEISIMVDDNTTYMDEYGYLCARVGGPRWEIREDATGNKRLAIVIPEEE